MRLDHKEDSVLLKGMEDLGADYKQLKLKLMPMSIKIISNESPTVSCVSLSFWRAAQN